ncbi:MAG TPA: LuxR C-terminal-related transcriptional regulator [Solirubrobacterales bacterium]|nr:LuxR C-terminal-related transcriptional regulator [Solirubrobacterales bacterium]
MNTRETTTRDAGPTRARRGELSKREREIVGMLAEGLSGAEIAAKLVLSPETVRTHIRNAMGKLGAATRSQAVALAIQDEQIEEASPAPPRGSPGPRPSPAKRPHGLKQTQALEIALEGMLANVCELPDIASAVVLLTEEDGLSLRRAALAAAEGAERPRVAERIVLGDGPLGRVALNRRAAVISSLNTKPPVSGTSLAAPMLEAGRLVGVVGLTARTSRPAGQNELLVVQAFVNRLAEVLSSGEDIDRKLEMTVRRFAASWSTTTS